MRRREFLGVVAGAAAAWPLAADAQQQPVMPVVGFLRSTSLAPFQSLVPAFRQGLKEAGFVEGQNVAVEYRYADNQIDRLPVLAAELVQRPATVIAGNNLAALAAKAATTTVPIVFVTGGDPVQEGLVGSLNRPGGNVTGISFFSAVLGAKRLDLLRQFIPKATTIGVLVHPNSADTEAERADVVAAAQTTGQKLVVLDIRSDRDIEAAFEELVKSGIGALLVGTGAFLNSHRSRMIELANRHQIPTMYTQRDIVAVGGLMSYGSNIADGWREAGVYTGRILKGEKPADLPVKRATKFDFAINLKTAKTLGLEFHPQLLATADEVIE
jgi:putative ABC transport system substrate-binding protein